MPSPIHITNSYTNCHVTHNGPQVNSVANSPPAAPNDKYVSRPEASNVGGSHDGVEEAGNVKDSDDGVKEAGDDKQKKKSKAISDALVPKICTNGKFRALTALSAPSVHEKGGFWRETREREIFCALTENSVH